MNNTNNLEPANAFIANPGSGQERHPRHLSFLFHARLWIFCAICFVLPMRASFIYLGSALLLIVWVAEGQLMQKISKIFRSKLCIACIIYFLAFFIAMLWTENRQTGWQMVGSQRPFLLFLLFWSSSESEYKERYVTAFLAGLCVCAVLAYYNLLQLHWFPEWPRGIRVLKNPSDTAPFVDWIMYAPMLALGAYLSLRRALFVKIISERIAYSFIAGLILLNLAFSGGRAGMIMFVVLLVMLVFERIKARGKAALLCAVILPLFFLTAYSAIHSFAARVDAGISDIRTFSDDPNTSVGQRMVYWTTTFRLFLQHPVLGVGSGDLQTEYAKIKPEQWAMTPDSYNPHNQYLMTAATTGLLGLTGLFFVFYAAAAGSDMRTKSFLVGFAVLCLFESYLWRSNTTLAFSVMLAFLTKKETEGRFINRTS